MYKNNDPFKPWNNPIHDFPNAPHRGYDSDNPSKPWNNPFGRDEDLTDDEADYYGVRRNKYNEDETNW
jgi:hypothetical protein